MRRNLANLIIVIFIVAGIFPMSASLADSYEPDNDYQHAQTITIDGQAQVHAINPAGDIDWITFTLESAADVVIETSGASGDTVMGLYDSQANVLMADDDSGVGSFSRIHTILPAGRYFVKINEFNVKSTIAEYLVSALATPFKIVTVNPNSTPQGSDMKLTITGYATTFFKDSSTVTAVWLSNGSDTIYAAEYKGIDATTLEARFVIPADAGAGKWNVHVTDSIDGIIAPLQDGFTIYKHPDLNGDGKVDAEDLAYFTRHWMEATVPDVINLELAEAEKRIIDAALTTGTITKVFHPTVPLGKIISSEPVAGKKAGMGNPVNLTLSKGYETTVPVVRGLTEAEARALIESEGLTVGTVNQAFNPDITLGAVISSEPAAGTKLTVGSTIALLISKGYETTVPDVTGLTEAEAVTKIEAASLTMGSVTNEFHESVPAGKVITTEPVSGCVVAVNSSVNLRISKGYETMVPDVVGKTKADAEAAILDASLKTGKVEFEYHPTIASGMVIRSEPTANTKVRFNSAVDLYVSKGYETVVPGVRGMNRSEAESVITSALLTVGNIMEVFHPTIPTGCIIDTAPEAGRVVTLHTGVNLTVSKGYQTMVPDTTGISLSDAENMILNASLVVGTVEYVFNPDIPFDHIVSTIPVAGSNVEVCSTINFICSKGYQTTVPDVTGMTYQEATSAIESAQLIVGTLTYSYHPSSPAGTVISSEPKANRNVNIGSNINLLISNGNETIVPNVTGLSLTAAEVAIVTADLVIGTVSEAVSDTVAEGYVISQFPSSGENLLAGSAVNLVVSVGPKPKPDITWVSINDPGVSGHEGFNGQMSKYETTNAQYCQFLNAALASGDITISGTIVYGASGSNSGADFAGQLYYDLAGPGFTNDGATNGGAARINWTDSSFIVDSGFENHPVTCVSWYGSTAFCNYYGWRLPTEWEWQAVADFDGSYTYGCGTTINNSIANYYGSAHPHGTTPVGAFGVYGYGMADMAGNVWEWTSSLYYPAYSYRMFRGGCWHDNGNRCSVSSRSSDYPDSRNLSLGFRVCR